MPTNIKKIIKLNEGHEGISKNNSFYHTKCPKLLIRRCQFAIKLIYITSEIPIKTPIGF